MYKIINKIYVKVVIAQNDTDLSCIKLDINVSKCFTKALSILWIKSVSPGCCITRKKKRHLVPR